MIYVVTPGYNCEKFVKETIVSLHKQSYENWFLVFVDDGSTDKTHMVAKKNSGNKAVILSIKNGGAAAARNYALDYIKKKFKPGDAIAFLDSDDLWSPKKLERQVQVASKNKKNKVVYTNGLIIDEGSKNIKSSLPHFNKNCTLKSVIYQNPVATSSVFISISNSTDLEKLKFDENLNGTEDWDLWIRLLSLNFHFIGMDEKLISYRVSRNSLSSFSLNYFINNLKVLEKNNHIIKKKFLQLDSSPYTNLLSKFTLQLIKRDVKKRLGIGILLFSIKFIADLVRNLFIKIK